MADVFVSYKKRDRALVEGLVKDLEAEGFTVWWDYEIDSGEDWLERILKEVDVARCVVGVWTPAAVSPNGTFIPSEGTNINYVRIEHERGARKLVPALCESLPALPVQFADLQAADLRGRRLGDRAHLGFRSLVARIEAYAMPSWAQARLTGLEARLAQEGASRAAAEGRLRAIEQELRSASERFAAERIDIARRAREEAKAHSPNGAGVPGWSLVVAAVLAASFGIVVGWTVQPASPPAAGVTEVAAAAASPLDLLGVWGGGEFTCASLPVSLSLDDRGLIVLVGNAGGGAEPTRETLSLAEESGWFRSVGSGGANFWRRDGETLLWRVEAFDNAASETRLQRCGG